MKNFFLKNPSRVASFVAVLVVVLFVAVSGSGAYAQSPGFNPNAPAPNTNIENIEGIFAILFRILNILFWALMVLAILFILLAAFGYLTANGDPEKIEKSNKRVIYSLVAVGTGVLAKSGGPIICNFLVGAGTSECIV